LGPLFQLQVTLYAICAGEGGSRNGILLSIIVPLFLHILMSPVFKCTNSPDQAVHCGMRLVTAGKLKLICVSLNKIMYFSIQVVVITIIAVLGLQMRSWVAQ